VVATFETRRLLARRAQPDDFENLVRMHTDPSVMATLGGKVWTREETQAFLERVLRHWDHHGYGVWMLHNRDDGAFVGRAGLRRKRIDGYEETQLLFACMPEFWAQGLATEAAHGVIEIAFNRLMLPNLVSFTRHDNAASRRVIEKSGFTFERDFIHDGLLHALYRRRRPTGGTA